MVQIDNTAQEREAEECEKKSAPVEKKPVSAAEAREEVAKLVWESAGEITKKLIKVATEEGQLGQVKYLFEMAGIHPANSEETTAKPEQSLIYSWLKELGLPAETPDKEAVCEDGSGERIL